MQASSAAPEPLSAATAGSYGQGVCSKWAKSSVNGHARGRAYRVMSGHKKHKDDVVVRLRRIEGQVRGLQRMVEEDTYCIDVLTQVSAVTRALQSFALQMLDEHMATCVSDAVAEGGEEKEQKLKEASDAIARLVRS
ncbi:metal-sensitive transcriptional regulator [Streptomyces sp. 7N604]|uniref:metal-sensitive transcriptional regulator n=1 Tax=Streptomyces sp. 7N604 TaxID=3457415 RepID=UPI003FD27C42